MDDPDDLLRADLIAHARSRGGVKRKAKSDIRDKASRSASGEYILRQWGYNFFSACEVQRLAHVVCEDIAIAAAGGQSNKFLEELAAMGNHGKYPNNISRDLKTFVEARMPVMPTTVATIPLHVHKGDNAGDHMLESSFLEPHVSFAWLCEHYKAAFEKRFGAIEAEINKFWTSVRADDPRRTGNPHFANPNLFRRGIPIALYGDGVPCTKKASYVAYGFESLLPGPQSLPPLEKIQFIGGYFDKTHVGPDSPLGSTKEAIHTLICHSVGALEDGIWPAGTWDRKALSGHAAAMAGQLLAEGWFCVPWLFKGDYEFRINHIGMPGHWSSAHPCDACEADCLGGDRDWRNFRPDAGWKPTSFVSRADWIALCVLAGKVPPLFFRSRVDRGLNMHPICAIHCILHNLDLGITKHILGNAFFRLTYGGMVALPTLKARVVMVWSMVQAEYKKKKELIQVHKLALSSFCDDTKPYSDYPLAKGKGAEMRHLAPITRIVFASFVRAGDSEDEHMLRVLTHLAEIYSVIDYKGPDGNPPSVWPEDVVRDFQLSIERMLVHYSFLHGVAARTTPARLLYNVVPKFHHLWHLGQQALYTNPRIGWTYSNEDWMGLIQRVGMAYRHGVAMSHRSGPMVRAWALGQAVTLKYGVP